MAASVPPDAEPRPWYRSERTLLVAATVVTLLPLLVAIPRVLVDGMAAPNGDDALIELRVRDVGGTDSPLTGSYGRFGWNHPGPLLFYVLSVPYRLLGARFAGLQVGVLLLGIASVLGIVWVAARRGGAVLALWALLVVSVLASGLGPRSLSDPWEPHSTVLPATLLLFLAWDTAAGRAWSLPLVIGVGSILGAAQATLLPFVAAMASWAVIALGTGALLRRRRGQPVDRRLLLAAGLAVVVGAVLWVPTVAEELKNRPGNLSAMWEFLREPQETLGLADGARSVALQLGTEAAWLGFDPPLVAFTTTVDTAAAPAVPVALVALAAGIALAAWRRDRSLLLGATALVALGAGVFAMSQLVGDLFPWLLEWTRVLGAATWLAAGWCAYRGLGERGRARAATVLVPVLATGLVVASVAGIVDAVRHQEDDGLAQAFDDLARASERAVAEVDAPVLVRSEVLTDRVVFGSGIGPEQLALALERSGVDVVVERDLAYQFGDHRAKPGRAVAELVLVSGRPDDAELGGGRLVATADPLTSDQRLERDRLDRELARRTQGDAAAPDLGAAAEAIDRDPSLRALLEASDAIPDLPLLSVVERPLP